MSTILGTTRNIISVWSENLIWGIGSYFALWLLQWKWPSIYLQYVTQRQTSLDKLSVTLRFTWLGNVEISWLFSDYRFRLQVKQWKHCYPDKRYVIWTGVIIVGPSWTKEYICSGRGHTEECKIKPEIKVPKQLTLQSVKQINISSFCSGRNWFVGSVNVSLFGERQKCSVLEKHHGEQINWLRLPLKQIFHLDFVHLEYT